VRRAREAAIEDLGRRYEALEAQIEAQTDEIRRERARQKREMDTLRRELAGAREVESARVKRLGELRDAQFRDQGEWQRGQRALDEHRAVLEGQFAELRRRAEAAAAKLRDVDAVLAELVVKEGALEGRARSAAEELQRQHNEALRAKAALDGKREALAALKGQIARIRAERRARPRVSAVAVPVQELPSPGFPSTLAEFGVFSALSPVPSDSNDGQEAVVAELRAQLAEAKRTAAEFAQDLATKRAQVEARRADGSRLAGLREENARLRARRDEMDRMKDEITRYRQERPAI